MTRVSVMSQHPLHLILRCILRFMCPIFLCLISYPIQHTILALYPDSTSRVPASCAPCVPFSCVPCASFRPHFSGSCISGPAQRFKPAHFTIYFMFHALYRKKALSFITASSPCYLIFHALYRRKEKVAECFFPSHINGIIEKEDHPIIRNLDSEIRYK